MDARELLKAHCYEEAIDACRTQLATSPDDWAAMGTLASAYRAMGAYSNALEFFERIDAHERKDPLAPGRSGRQKDISCLYWCMGDRVKSIQLMRELAQGVLNSSIRFGDLAGGVQQGLLLYYMGVTAEDPEATSFALAYMRDRAERPAARMWPGPLAQYYLGQISFEEVLVAATGRKSVGSAIDVAQTDLLKRRQLCGALFHDGTKSRVQGAKERCLARMRECHSLEDPLIEPEWYLARYEVAHARDL
jgi:tetratricopeptide (TPR) repeat protein